MTETHEYAPVLVRHTGTLSVREELPPYSTHFTKVIPPHASDVLIPQDPDRYRVTIFGTAGNYGVLSDSMEASQASGNLAATQAAPPPTPAGTVFISGGQQVTEYDSEVLYVTNCDPVASLYVSVVIERSR